MLFFGVLALAAAAVADPEYGFKTGVRVSLSSPAILQAPSKDVVTKNVITLMRR